MTTEDHGALDSCFVLVWDPSSVNNYIEPGTFESREESLTSRLLSRYIAVYISNFNKLAILHNYHPLCLWNNYLTPTVVELC